MNFDHQAGSRITKVEFDLMHKAFKEKFAGHTEAHYMGRAHLEKLLALPGCAGIRSYHGLNEQGHIVHMHIAYDTANHPLADAEGVVIMERGQPCPPVCNNGGSL